MTLTSPKTAAWTDPRHALWWWALALGVWSFLVARGYLVTTDESFRAWSAAIHSPSLDGLMRRVTFFGSSSWTILALVGLGLWTCRHGGVRAVGVLAGAFLVGGMLEVVLRLVVPHWRPDAPPIPASMDLISRFELSGFPSGHAFRSAFVFGGLIQRLKGVRWGKWGKVACLVMMTLVGFSRVHLNRHWASDVLGAWLVVLVTFSIARCWQKRFYKQVS